MARNPEFLKHFEDVNLDALGFGGLGGLGSAHHVKTNAKPTREGVKMSVNCDHCGEPNIILVEGPEAVIISQGRMPGGWKYIQGYVQPQIGCNQCQKVSAPGVTPDEATRWVKAALSARFIDPSMVAAIAQRAQHGMR